MKRNLVTELSKTKQKIQKVIESVGEKNNYINTLYIQEICQGMIIQNYY